MTAATHLRTRVLCQAERSGSAGTPLLLRGTAARCRGWRIPLLRWARGCGQRLPGLLPRQMRGTGGRSCFFRVSNAGVIPPPRSFCLWCRWIWICLCRSQTAPPEARGMFKADGEHPALQLQKDRSVGACTNPTRRFLKPKEAFYTCSTEHCENPIKQECDHV